MIPPKSHRPIYSERYAFLWKKSAFRLKRPPALDKQLAAVCYREPYLAKFLHLKSHQEFWLVNFHARKHDQNPEIEIKALCTLPQRLDDSDVIIAGDFNIYQNDEIWECFYDQGYQSALNGVATTLKRKCNAKGEYFPASN